MTVTNTFLFYRTPTTLKSDINFEDPEDLPSAQKLLFIPSADMIYGVDEEWKNNIVRKIPTQPAGRKIVQTDEGLASWIPIISGTFEIDAGEARTQIHNFRKISQSDSFHVNGIFGLQYPDGPEYFNIDPNDTLGLMIEFTRGKHTGITKEIMDFAIGLSYGGQI